MLQLLFLLLFPLVSFAAEPQQGCQTTWNLPDFLLKPRQQADIGWCYAYAAADLASAYQGQLVSAGDLAIAKNASTIRQSYFSTKNSAFKPERTQLRDGGHADDALLARIEDGGFCAESDFPSEIITKITDDPKRKMTKFAQFTIGDRIYAALKLGRLNQSPLDCDSSPAAPAEIGFPNLPAKAIVEILGKMNDLDGDQNRSYRTAALAARNCENRRSAAQFTGDQVITKRLNIKEMDHVLASGRLAAIGLPRNLEPELADIVGGHMMLLVGQKWNSEAKQCEYIFKNSWGDKTKPSENMKNGYMTIPREKLANLTRGELTTIDKTPTWTPAAFPEFLR